MTKRFRMIAGPNGSGKSTLTALLRNDYMDKVIARAKRSLGNIKEALPYCSRAFFFDNSSIEMEFLAEYSQENGMSVKSDDLPDWFKAYVL